MSFFVKLDSTNRIEDHNKCIYLLTELNLMSGHHRPTLSTQIEMMFSKISLSIINSALKYKFFVKWLTVLGRY